MKQKCNNTIATPRLPRYALFASAFLLVATSCSRGADSAAVQQGKVLLASSLSRHDVNSGVVQASPGIESSEGGLIGSIAGVFSSGASALSVPADRSLFRLKVSSASAPAGADAGAGAVHYVIEYDDLAHLVKTRGGRHGAKADWVTVEVDRVLAYTRGGAS